MAEGARYEGKPYKIAGFGRDGDARVVNPDGKTVFVSGVPNGMKVGAIISVTDYLVKPGTADFARYAALPQASQGRASPPTLQSQVQVPHQVSAVAPAQSLAQQTVYILHIGPTSKGDDSAIAIVRGDVLDMKAYDAVMHLITHHADKFVFADTTDRRIADRLNEIVARAKGENALDELVITIGNAPVTPATPKPLKDYFTTPAQGGKYSAQAVVKQEGQAEAAVLPVAAGALAQPQRPQVARAVSTVARKGSPGSILELLV